MASKKNKYEKRTNQKQIGFVNAMMCKMATRTVMTAEMALSKM